MFSGHQWFPSVGIRYLVAYRLPFICSLSIKLLFLLFLCTVLSSGSELAVPVTWCTPMAGLKRTQREGSPFPSASSLRHAGSCTALLMQEQLMAGKCCCGPLSGVCCRGGSALFTSSWGMLAGWPCISHQLLQQRFEELC